MENGLLRFALVLGVHALLASAQCTDNELNQFAQCVRSRTPNLKPSSVDYFQSNLTQCFISNGCAAPDFSGTGYQDAPRGFQAYATDMQKWFNNDLSQTERSCISSQMMTSMQNEQNLGGCIPADLQTFLTNQHQMIFNKVDTDQNQQHLTAASNARIAAKQCGNPEAIDTCIMQYKRQYYTAVGCAIRSKCMQKKLSAQCSDHITQELPSACTCLQAKKQQLFSDADADAVSTAQKYYAQRKNDLNNAATACGVDPDSMPQLTDYFPNHCPQGSSNGNTAASNGGNMMGLLSSNAQASVDQGNSLSEYACIGTIAQANQPKFHEMSQRIQAITDDEPAFCKCQQ